VDFRPEADLDRRQVLQGVGGAMALTIPSLGRGARAAEAPLVAGLAPGAYETATLEALQGKKPLIKLTTRPPNYETPVSYFTSGITPNDAFFVRYHLSAIPRVDAANWRLDIGGEGAATPYMVSFNELQTNFEQVEIAAVCQCSGNRRGLSDPHVPGVQWGPGAMGNAVWRGPRLKDVLARAGLQRDVVEIVVDGADSAPLTGTPDFVKSIPLAKALDDNTIIAHRMNGEALPHFNGFPARLIVPGWTATYWMKHMISIRAAAKPFDGFWMRGAYRIPNNMFPVVQRFLSQETEVNTPITEMVVNSLIAAPAEGQRFQMGQMIDVQGVAWDGGFGIARVDVSADSGATWRPAALGPDSGRFAFRTWSHRFAADSRGNRRIMAKATNRIGQSQVDTLIFNPAGYHNNVSRPTTIVIA
jgi:DMSO/TMAO reductase YedYZ molybdopterin-dependent catalytic subunit